MRFFPSWPVHPQKRENATKGKNILLAVRELSNIRGNSEEAKRRFRRPLRGKKTLAYSFFPQGNFSSFCRIDAKQCHVSLFLSSQGQTGGDWKKEIRQKKNCFIKHSFSRHVLQLLLFPIHAYRPTMQMLIWYSNELGSSFAYSYTPPLLSKAQWSG